jgi:meromycolic acid enoyl-[acyl-carrier-protein] reductase
MLAGRRILITGVITHRSIAFAVAAEAQRQGAEVLLTSFGRGRRLTERAARRLPEAPDVLELDVNSATDLAVLATDLEQRWGRVDGVLHAIANAPADALGGGFLATPAVSAEAAFRTSAYSLSALAGALRPLLAAGGATAGETARGSAGSVVALDFDASVAWPSYDWMGVAKAALESVARYLARDLGPQGIRVNLVAAGPVETPAAGGIPGFDELAGGWSERAPLGWDARDPTPIAAAVCFLLSDLARGITGEILHVDGGAHAIGATPPTGAAAGRSA